MRSFELHSMELTGSSSASVVVESPQRRSVSDLPDLTGRLIRDGLHEEYLQYRERYMAWRQGSSSGAVGELFALGAPRVQRTGSESFSEMWHPSAQKFDFFYTVSYWVAVIGLMGAMMITTADIAAVVAAEKVLQDRRQLLSMISAAGDVLFTLSCYLSYFELINFPEDGGRKLYLLPNWDCFWGRVSTESVVGIVAYLVGMLAWDISDFPTFFFFELHGDLSRLLLEKVPVAMGGFAFLLGGFCEVVHNRRRGRRDIVVWVSFINAVGGALLALGSVLGFTPANHSRKVCMALGMALYTVSCVMLLVMWRSNDFGLTLLRQLNASLGEGAQITISATAQGLRIQHTSPSLQARELAQNGSRKLSMRGVIFLVIYCWLFACGAMNCLAGLFMATGASEHLFTLTGGILWLVVVTLVLIVHSSVTSVPNQQPYWCAMQAMRCTLFLTMLWQTAFFGRWWHHLHHPWHD